LLPKTALIITTRILLVVYFFFVLEAPLRAADFSSTLDAGKSLGTGILSDYNPTNLNQTLQN
jgi:hypothetical protein